MEFVEEVLSWIGDLSSGSHGCDELALEPQYEYYQEPEPYQEQEHEHEHEQEQEQEENDEQPAGEDQKEEGRSSSNDKKHMKNAAALGLGKAKVGAEKAKEKVKGKINWIKEPICACMTFLVIIQLFGGFLMQGQLEKEAKRRKIIVSKFHNFS